jgi:CheY-like chemotaxis protein
MSPENRGRLLVVDDDPSQLAVITTLMAKKLKYLDMDTVSSGKAALVRASEISYDLFLLDVRLGGMSGIDLADQLRAMDGYSDVPILFLSAANQAPVSKRYPEESFYAKPAQTDELAVEIEEVIALKKINDDLGMALDHTMQIKHMMSS